MCIRDSTYPCQSAAPQTDFALTSYNVNDVTAHDNNKYYKYDDADDGNDADDDDGYEVNDMLKLNEMQPLDLRSPKARIEHSLMPSNNLPSDAPIPIAINGTVQCFLLSVEFIFYCGAILNNKNDRNDEVSHR